MDAYSGCLQWLFTVGVYGSCLRWLFTVDAYSGCLQWVFTVVVYGGCLRCMFALDKQKWLVMSREPQTFVSSAQRIL